MGEQAWRWVRGGIIAVIAALVLKLGPWWAVLLVAALVTFIAGVILELLKGDDD